MCKLSVVVEICRASADLKMRKANLKTLELTKVDRPAAHPATAARGLHLAETEQLCNLAYPAYLGCSRYFSTYPVRKSTS